MKLYVVIERDYDQVDVRMVTDDKAAAIQLAADNQFYSVVEGELGGKYWHWVDVPYRPVATMGRQIGPAKIIGSQGFRLTTHAFPGLTADDVKP